MWLAPCHCPKESTARPLLLAADDESLLSIVFSGRERCEVLSHRVARNIQKFRENADLHGYFPELLRVGARRGAGGRTRGRSRRRPMHRHAAPRAHAHDHGRRCALPDGGDGADDPPRADAACRQGGCETSVCGAAHARRRPACLLYCSIRQRRWVSLRCYRLCGTRRGNARQV